MLHLIIVTSPVAARQIVRCAFYADLVCNCRELHDSASFGQHETKQLQSAVVRSSVYVTDKTQGHNV